VLEWFEQLAPFEREQAIEAVMKQGKNAVLNQRAPSMMIALSIAFSWHQTQSDGLGFDYWYAVASRFMG
jgi:hypothetical protein